jgi:ferredoxin
MEIGTPVWQLKKRCPCCKEGYLELFTCVKCGSLVAICDEIGTIFQDFKNISFESITIENQKCVMCGNASDFRIAKDTEIINFGLTINDYE